jgi:hypothetical protein
MKRLGQVTFSVFAWLVIAAALGFGVYEQYRDWSRPGDVIFGPVPQAGQPAGQPEVTQAAPQPYRQQRDEAFLAAVSGSRYAEEIDECWGGPDMFADSFADGFCDEAIRTAGSYGVTVRPRRDAIRELALEFESEAKAIFAVAYVGHRDAGMSQWDPAAARGSRGRPLAAAADRRTAGSRWRHAAEAARGPGSVAFGQGPCPPIPEAARLRAAFFLAVRPFAPFTAKAPDVAGRLLLVDLQRKKDRVCFGTLSSLALVINHGHFSSMCQPDERSFAWAAGSVGEAEGRLLAEMNKALEAWLDREIQEAAQRRQAAETERAQHQADLELARATGGDDGVQLYELLDRHDWSYEYSDDGTVWRRGRAQQQRTVELMSKLGRDAALVIWSCRAPPGLCIDAYLAAT